MNDDNKIEIPNFDEQVSTFNDLARNMNPTRNKENVRAFIQSLEKVFASKEWNYSLYCKKITMDAYDRKEAKKKSGKLDETSNTIGDDLKKVIDNMS